MYQKVQALLEWRAELLMARRFDDLAGTYIIPKVAFLEGQQLVLPSISDVTAALEKLVDGLQSRGVFRLSPGIKALEIPRDNRFRVWVHWRETSKSPENDGSSDAIYYFCNTDSGLRTEMMDFSRVSRPEYRHLNQDQAAMR
jgi:hypothetical protein